MQSSIREVARGRVRDESSGNSRNRGRGRKQQVGMGGRKRGRVLYHAKSSSSDGNSSNNEHEVHDEKLQDPCKLRRSTRSRNPVYYSVNNLECDDAEDMGDECANKQAIDQELSSRKGLSEDAPIGPTDKNQSNFTDPLSDIGIGEIQCVMGSGVCMDKDEMCEPSVRHSDDNTECSYDYLTMGGGFCMDEDEADQPPEEQVNNPASATIVEVTADKTVHENLAESGCSHEETLNGLQVGRQTEAASAVLIKNFLNDNSNVSVPSEENTKDHTSRNSVRALSAMPLLRRKQRKS